MDEDLISEWFHLYYKDIYHFLIYYTGSSDVEDLVQEVFIRAIKGFDSFEGDASPKTWLFSIARHAGIDEMRKRKRARLKQRLFLQEQHVMNTPEEIFQLNESNKLLYEFIQLLKTSYREVVILRGVKEMSVSECATILNWSESKVRVTYHRALKALQKKKEDLNDEARSGIQ